MRESRTSGSVRGVAREGHPYLDRAPEGEKGEGNESAKGRPVDAPYCSGAATACSTRCDAR